MPDWFDKSRRKLH